MLSVFDRTSWRGISVVAGAVLAMLAGSGSAAADPPPEPLPGLLQTAAEQLRACAEGVGAPQSPGDACRTAPEHAPGASPWSDLAGAADLLDACAAGEAPCDQFPPIPPNLDVPELPVDPACVASTPVGTDTLFVVGECIPEDSPLAPVKPVLLTAACELAYKGVGPDPAESGCDEELAPPPPPPPPPVDAGCADTSLVDPSILFLLGECIPDDGALEPGKAPLQAAACEATRASVGERPDGTQCESELGDVPLERIGCVIAALPQPDAVECELPEPEIAALVPERVTAGAGDVELTVIGEGFVEDSRVVVGDRPIETKFESQGELRATVPTDLLTKPARAAVTVGNGTAVGLGIGRAAVAGRQSRPVDLVILPAPEVRAFSPSEITVGLGALELKIEVAGAKEGVTEVLWNGRTVVPVTAGFASVAVTAAETAEPGPLTATAYNPDAPGPSHTATLDVVPRAEVAEKKESSDDQQTTQSAQSVVPPAPVAEPPSPPPVRRDRPFTRRVVGEVVVRSSDRARRLGDAEAVPRNTVIDARRGKVVIGAPIDSPATGRTQTVVVSKGRFRLRLMRIQGRVHIELRPVAPPRRSRQSKRRPARLFVSGHCRCRVVTRDAVVRTSGRDRWLTVVGRTRTTVRVLRGRAWVDNRARRCRTNRLSRNSTRRSGRRSKRARRSAAKARRAVVRRRTGRRVRRMQCLG